MSEDDPEESGVRERREEALFERMGLAPTNFAAAVLTPSITYAKNATADATGRRWRPFGARNIGGRVRAIAQDPADARVMYAGAASGGLHRTTDGGDTWEPVGGPDEIWSVGAIAVALGDNQVIVVGTGEFISLPGAPNPHGVGIRRSLDRGRTWVALSGPSQTLPPTPAPPPGSCERVAAIAIDPEHKHRFWAATNTGLWRWEPTAHNAPAAGVPAGAFQADGLPAGSYSDVLLFGDPDETPGAGGQHRYLIVIAGRNDGTIHRTRFDRNSATAALAWTQIPTGLPANAVRMVLACCKSNPKLVYALSSLQVFVPASGTTAAHNEWRPTNLLASIDGGQSFTTRGATESSTQGWYTLALACHPTDPNIVVMGCLEILRSTDGGNNFQRILDWRFHNNGIDDAQHADEHVLVFDHEDRNRLWAGNDGGISVARDITADPSAPRFWRKRSHGLQLAQFNDVAIHPTMTYIAGGGLQDNGTFAGVGGGTWLHIDKGDGGLIGLEPNNVRQISSNATFGRPARVSIADPGTMQPPGLQDTLINKAPDVPASPRMVYAIARPGVPAGVSCPFVGMVEQVGANLALLATNGGRPLLWNTSANTFTPFGAPTNATAVSAMAVAPGAAATNWWFGNISGEVWKTQNANAGPFPNHTAALVAQGHAATGFPPPGPPPATPPAARVITRILIHPNNNNYVVVATGGDSSFPLPASAAGAQGRVFLTVDGGTNWIDLTGTGGGANRALPPCPVNALAFDPTRAANQTQTLYAGTVVGVWKLEGLPAANPAGALAAPAPILWRTFGNLTDPAPGSEGKLPLLIISDLVAVTHPATPGAAAGTYEASPRHKLIAATFGRGMFECDLAPPASAPRHRLFIRQHVIEDGLHYPRPSAATLNTAFNPASPNLFHLQGDPRFPATAPGNVAFFDDAAYDIRIDNRTALFQFFEDRVDGVELDEELGVESLLPAEANSLYVQVHNRGTHTIADAEVMLFYADTSSAPPLAAVPNLPNDFWARYRANDPMPPAAAPIAAGAADWRRIGRRTGLTVRPGDPLVVRFDFEPPANLSERNVSLLAITVSPANDALGAAPAPPTAIATLLTRERRAALRRVAVARLERRVYLRDGVEDSGGAGAPAVAFGARSPDIVVVQDEVDPVATFVDLIDRRPIDRLTGARDNFVYVRVFNPSNAPVRVRVELWSAKASDPTASASVQANWQTVPPRNPPGGPAPPPGTPVPDTIDVPARGHAYARFVMRNVADPTPAAALAPASSHRAYLLAALIAAETTILPGASPTPPVLDQPIPDRGASRDATSFLRFFRILASSRRAAMRILRYDT